MTDQERTLLLYLADAVREHLHWSSTGPRVSLKLFEMIEAVKKAETKPALYQRIADSNY